MITLKRQFASLVFLVFVASSSTVANAQIADKILMQTVSWLLQKQIDEMEKANDTSRGLKEYNPQNSFSSGDQFAPRDQFQYQATPNYPIFNKANETVSPQTSEQAVPAVTQ